MKPRTSQSHPLRIASLDTPVGGRIGMTFCPGKHDPVAMTGPRDWDLASDLEVIAGWGACALVTLMETHELVHLGVADIGAITESLGITCRSVMCRFLDLISNTHGKRQARRCASECRTAIASWSIAAVAWAAPA
jgi:hypothetical protein